MSPGWWSPQCPVSHLTPIPIQQTLAIPKLHDDGSNLVGLCTTNSKGNGVKGLWRHIEGTAVTPAPYALVNGIPILSNGKNTSDRGANGDGVLTGCKREYIASMSSFHHFYHLGTKIKDLKRQRTLGFSQGWCYHKNTLYLLDTEDQLASMSWAITWIQKTHLTELKEQFH